MPHATVSLSAAIRFLCGRTRLYASHPFHSIVMEAPEPNATYTVRESGLQRGRPTNSCHYTIRMDKCFPANQIHEASAWSFSPRLSVFAPAVLVVVARDRVELS